MDTEMPQKAKKGLSRIIYGRTGLVLLLLLVQVGILAWTFFIMRDYMMVVYSIFQVISVIVVVWVISDGGTPEYRMTWMLCIFMFPIVGAAFFMYGRAEVGVRHIGKRLSALRDETSKYMEQDMDIISQMKTSRVSNTKLSYYLSKQLGFPTYSNTKVAYFPLGEDKFDSLLRELKQAKRFIFMEYFIVKEGRMWDTILEVLAQKAEEGVEVRFMYDGMCSVSMLPYDYPSKLKRMGIKCKMFNPIRPVLSTVQNNRDHRKICVVDGRVGYTGGINLADEYINEEDRFGHWKDTAVKLKGDAVQSLTVMFLQMWNVDEKHPESYQQYMTPQTGGFDLQTGYVLPYADSPFDNEDVGAEVYLHILNHAREYVHIMTPYLILDYDMMSTLTRVAKSGVEVIIIMPGIPDKQYAFDLAKTYYRELLEAGVQIYEYRPGFVHAKVFVSDDDTATVGTVNLDYRSLYLHFECGVFIYQNQVVQKIEKDFQDTLAQCHKVTLVEVKSRSLYTKIKGHLLRLIAPLM
ncbi:cardiolipin synthase [Lachnospiraceae bacterium OttesenSCG-928-E19]|nr:cardiolipin synthase [Lachnospiraceae bacterium OttesenSCG-928-E19]